jgi:Zn-dependent protease
VSANGASPPRRCSACGTELPAAFLACPSCGTLVHAGKLKELAAAAEDATRAGDKRVALHKWREALALLPMTTKQHAHVRGLVAALSAEVDALPLGGAPTTTPGASAATSSAPAADGPAPRKRGPIYTALAAVGAVLLKFKLAIFFVLAKGKLLLAGLFQAKTFLSMAIAVGAYTMLFGWRFAVGLIVSIYVHEMGHVERLRHYGIKASAPMFIPGFGAFVRLKQYPASPREDARVGLAGPLWGAFAALAFLVIGRHFHYTLAIAIARVGAWINLFNLTPVWQLDGGRAFNALARRQRAMLAGLLWVLAVMGVDGMLFLLAIGASFRAARKDAPEEGDNGAFLQYTGLVLGLVAIMLVAGRLPR